MNEKNKNEFYVVWKDPNFNVENPYASFLGDRKHFIEEKNIEVYYIATIEEALKIILQKRRENPNKKLILISNIGLDYSGKRLVEIVREIIGFDLIVLFFSKNKSHLGKENMKNFPNFLYTDTSKFYEKFISSYNKKELKKLKEDIENQYNIKIKDFTEDFLSYEKDNKILVPLEEINPYLRHASIYCQNKNKYLYMTKEGKVEQNETKSAWDITINTSDKTITLFSNGFYLKKNEQNKIIGYKFMEICKYEIIENDNYYFYFINNNNNEYLSMEEEGNGIKITSNPDKNEKFRIEEVYDEEHYINLDISHLTEKITNKSISITI